MHHAQAPEPITVPTAADRIAGYDVARALALLGMTVFHFALVMGRDAGRPAWLAGLLGLIDGRSAATFVVLAGIGLTLRSRRAESSIRGSVLLRGLFLLAVGYVNLIVWEGDILRVYGVSLLLAAWFLTAPGRLLLLVAGLFAAGFVVLLCLFDYEKNWTWETLSYHRLWTAEGAVRNLFYDGFRSVFPWTGFLFLGMWVGRHDLREPSVSRRFLLGGLGVALLAHLISWACLCALSPAPDGLDAETIQALFGTASMPPLPLFLAAGGGAAVALLAACVRFAARFPRFFLVGPLVATGRLALTWYVAHILLGLGTVVAFGQVGRQPLPVAAAAGLGFFAWAVVVSVVWRAWVGHGPLEGLMRKRTEGKRAAHPVVGGST
jgi:uncharacterized membrane protein YeiB